MHTSSSETPLAGVFPVAGEWTANSIHLRKKVLSDDALNVGRRFGAYS